MSLSHVYFIALGVKKTNARNYFASFLEKSTEGSQPKISFKKCEDITA